MNGIAILHLESGMMMYQNQFKKNFGIQNCDGNALQLTSKLFALYQASRSSAKSPAGCSQDRVGLQWFQLGKVRIAFGLQKNQDSIPMSFLELDLLTVLFLDSALEVAVSNKATEEFLKIMNSIPEEILVNGSATLKNKLYNWIDPKAREFLTDFNHLLISTSFNEYEVQCFQKLKMTSKDDCAIDGKTEHQIVLDKQKKELQTMRKSESSIVKSILKLFSYKKSRSSISGAPAEDSADCQKQSANIEVSEIACEPSDVTKSSISVSNENYVSFPIKAAVVNLNDLTYFKKHPHFFEKVMHVLCVCSGDTMELNRNQEFYGEELFVLIYSNYYLCCKKLENFKTSKMHRKLLDLLEFCSRCRILRSRTIRNIFLWKESNDVVNAI